MSLALPRSRPATRICALLLRLGLGAGCLLLMAAASENDAPSVLVQTVSVRQGSMPRVVSAFGFWVW